MRRIASVGLEWLHSLLLSVWLGGIVVMGAIAAPSVFAAARAAGDTERGTPLFDFAGNAVTTGFTRLNSVCLVVGLLALGAGVGSGLLGGYRWKWTLLRALPVALAWSISFYLAQALFPAMEAARGGDQGVFDALHHASGNWFRGEALLLAVSLAVTAWMHGREVLTASGKAAADSETTALELPGGRRDAPAI